MRLLAVFLCSALLASGQQAAAPAAPAAAQPPAAVSSGAVARMAADLDTPDAPWAGTKAWYRTTFKASDSRVTFEGPVCLRDYVINGKLTLSLKNYLDLVVANNTDIAVQRISLEIPKNAIQRAFSVFDPLVTSSFNATRATTPATNQLQGASVLSTLTQPWTARFQETLPTSTQVYTQMGWTKLSTNDSYSLFNPSYTNTWQTGLSQPLLRNRGAYITKLPILIARSQRRSSEFSTEAAIQTLLVTAENAYWDLISARERLKVQTQALDLADQSLKRSLKEVELGATSPLEIYQPQQNYATAQINLTQVKFQLEVAEQVLRRQISADLDPNVRVLPIELTEDVKAAIDESPLDREKLVATAISRRPDLMSTRQNLDVTDLQIQSMLNNMRPILNLTASYQSYGRGGTTWDRSVNPALPLGGSAVDAWSQMFGFNYNTFAFGFTLTLPLRDRSNAANLADAVSNKKLAALRDRTLAQQVRQDVLSAAINVESSRAAVKLAQIALDFAVKRSEADQKRYDLGTINIFFLLDSQNALTQAQSNLVNALVTYRRNVLNLQQRVGTLPEDKGVVIQ